MSPRNNWCVICSFCSKDMDRNPISIQIIQKSRNVPKWLGKYAKVLGMGWPTPTLTSILDWSYIRLWALVPLTLDLKFLAMLVALHFPPCEYLSQSLGFSFLLNIWPKIKYQCKQHKLLHLIRWTCKRVFRPDRYWLHSVTVLAKEME